MIFWILVSIWRVFHQVKGVLFPILILRIYFCGQNYLKEPQVNRRSQKVQIK